MGTASNQGGMLIFMEELEVKQGNSMFNYSSLSEHFLDSSLNKKLRMHVRISFK